MVVVVVVVVVVVMVVVVAVVLVIIAHQFGTTTYAIATNTIQLHFAENSVLLSRAVFHYLLLLH